MNQFCLRNVWISGRVFCVFFDPIVVHCIYIPGSAQMTQRAQCLPRCSMHAPARLTAPPTALLGCRCLVVLCCISCSVRCCCVLLLELEVAARLSNSLDCGVIESCVAHPNFSNPPTDSCELSGAPSKSSPRSLHTSVCAGPCVAASLLLRPVSDWCGSACSSDSSLSSLCA